ncbi:MAG: single-stranded-DNA-specific exonuclease RecJ [Oceanobacter sp.]
MSLIQQRPSLSPSDTQLPLDMHPVMQRVLSSRGVREAADIDHSLKRLMPYAAMKGLTEAVELLIPVVMSGRKLVVVGDFDVDGACSTALAVLVLRALGATSVSYLVPNRFEHGYGLTPELVRLCQPMQPDLIMTVDNGIAAVEGVRAAKAEGIQVLVTDHHLPGAELPGADAIVNPNQPGCAFTSKAACGCTVVFYLMLALRARLSQVGFERPLPNMAEYLDLVALATVADVVPLDHNNRILVEQGLRRIRSGHVRPGIRALIDAAGRASGRLVSSDFGFALGPRLNAAGRLNDMGLGIECLMSQSYESALSIARQLDELNRERRDIEHSMSQDAERYLKQFDVAQDYPAGLALYRADWHPGVVGILASRVKDKTHRPVIALAQDGNSLKGSARSIKGLHMRDALDLVDKRNPGLMQKFGGHAMAAGLSLVLPENQAPEQVLERFRLGFEQVCEEMLQPEDLQPVIWTDGELRAEELNFELAEQLRWAYPWGQAFPEPIFSGEFQLVQQRLVGGRHLKMVVQPLDSTQILDAIWFNIDPTLWPQPELNRARLVYQLDINEFRGQSSLQLLVRELIV